MPPKKQIKKDAILNKAFEITRSDGIESLTARSLAALLNCSTQPIYQAFTDMETLEKEVAKKSLAFMLQQMHTETEALPQDLDYVLHYIRFALEETHLFQVIAKNGLFAIAPEELSNSVPSIDPKLVIFANGIVFMTAYQSLRWSWAEIRHMVTTVYDDFRKDNTCDTGR
jgi:AcrR family transcriptional regulator